MTIQGIKELTCVVGIGASAGGLEALERFFRAVRPHANVAYVVVQHLSPEFKSMMGEILGRLTDLDIQPITDQMELQPDTVYLNVPRTKLTVQNGRFQQTAIGEEQGENIFKPIDTFFASLATEYQQNAVGVILSGTGNDGQLGVQQIVQSGGLILTQDLNSALFGSMPQAAKESVTFSVELTPEEMPEIIQDYIRDPQSVSPSFANLTRLDLLTEETALSFMLSLLQRKFQTDFTRYKPQTIVRRLERRMALDGAESLVDYARAAQQNEELLDQIYRELLIDVTRFFRDPEAFNWLETHLIPQIVQNKTDGESLRVWIAACSSGEEAYSLAMLFLEEIERQNKQLELRIFATDIHKSSIDYASEGKYASKALDQIPYHLGKKYFDAREGFVKVKKQLRQKIVFSVHDLLGDAYFGNQDLITCRNMLIYIRPKSQSDILQLFTNALNQNGYLFLGPSEHLTSRLVQYYETLSRHWRIFQKTSSPYPTQQKAIQNVNIHLPNHLHEKPFQEQTNLYQGWEPALLKALIPAGFVCNHFGELKEIYGTGKDYLNFSIGKVNLNLTELLADSLAIGLRNGLSQAQRKKAEIEISNIQVKVEEQTKIINLRIIPFEQDSIDQTKEETDQFYLVVLEEVRNLGQISPIDPAEIAPNEFNELHSLKLELAFTRESLQATLEEVETSNEELQSSNEELTAANEELQSTNEELSSVNEELYTVNSEYQEQNRRLNQLFNDKYNLERASGVLTIFLDEKLAIREMTPACYKAFDLIDADIGRPISQFTAVIGLDKASLQQLAELAQDGEQSAVETVSHKQVPMLLTVIPYQGDHARLNGVILHFVDLTLIRQLESENREMHSIADSIPVLMTHIDNDNRYKYVNDHFLQLTGKQREEVLGQHPRDVIGEANYQLLKPYHDRALQGEHVEFINDSFMMTKGRYTKNNFFPNWDGNEVDGFYCFAIEVTEFEVARQKALKELKLSEAQFKSVVETQSELISRWRPDDFVLTFVNPAYVRYYGADAGKELVGTSMLDWVNEDYSQAIKAQATKIIQTGEAQVIEEVKQLEDGSTRYYLWTDSPIFDADGNVIEIQGAGRDVTAERKAQQALEETHKRLEAINDGLPVWISIIDKNHKFQYLNNFYHETIGIDVEASLGKHVKQVLGKPIYSIGKPYYDKALKGETVTYLNYTSQDGQEKVGLVTLVPEKTGSESDYFYLLAIDISDQIQAQNRLENALTQLNMINDRLPVWISIVDKNYRYSYVNDFYMKSIGRKKEEFVGNHIKDALGKNFFKTGKPNYDRALAGERVDYLNKGMFDGEEVDIAVSLVPRKDEDGEVDGFFVLAVQNLSLQTNSQENSDFTAGLVEPKANPRKNA